MGRAADQAAERQAVQRAATIRFSEFQVFEPLTSLAHENFNYDAKFAEFHWNAGYFAQLALAEFAKSGFEDIDLADLKPPTDRDEIFGEIENLIGPDLDLREERAQEIVDQISGIVDYFAHILMLSPAQQNTLRVMEIADQAGLMAAMHFKYKFRRARPQQVFPGLSPLIPAPGHPAFPSGHALESHMIALALKQVLPNAGGAHAAIDTLADRIGKNREIAGVHYASDTEAGKYIADKTFDLLAQCPTFQTALKAAANEH